MFFVHPLADKFEVFGGLFHANNAHWITGAGGMPTVPSPRFWVAIHIHKVFAGELTPPLSGAVDKGLFYVGISFGFRLFFSREAKCDNRAKEDCSKNRVVLEIF